MYIYNSMSNKVEEFKSIKENEISIYVCGPTVYNYIHVGNARPLIVFDTLARYFKYIGYNVKFVQNFTDIDDKIINKSIEENLDFKVLTEKYIAAFMEDIEKINILDLVQRPKVSENLDEIIEMISTLIKKGYAYEKDGSVFFRIDKFKEYGKLSKQKIEDLEIGSRVKKDETKENPLDFVLWKAKKENEPYFLSPFSEGRPGWHIECSALAKKFLGNHFDIHGGGIDLLFPHHENEIAQSKCCNNSEFANYWMHNGYVEINGEKMSKSLNNFTLLRDILKIYDGAVLRFFMLSTHYRKPINFSSQALDVAKSSIYSIFETIKRYEKINIENVDYKIFEYINEFKLNFKLAIEDDLNTPLAISSIFTLINKVNKISNSNLKAVADILREYLEEILGIKFKESENDMEEKLLELINKIREEARKNKNYELSDMIRDELNKLGIKSYDGKVK